MPRDYLDQAPTAIRRSDRAVNDEGWINHFLHHAVVGTMALSHEGQPFVNTNLFVYDEDAHCIYTHTANVGRTRAIIEANPRVCFSIMEMGRLLPAPEALEFSVEYGGVTIFGEASIIDDDATATHALQILLDKYAPHLQAGSDYRPPMPEELKRTAVFRVSLDDMSAKKKEVESDFAGAYWYPEAPTLESVRTRTTWQGIVDTIYVAPETGAPMQATSEVEAIAGKGLKGDRYGTTNWATSHKPIGHVTLFAQESIEAVQAGGLPLQAHEIRRNIATRGVPLNDLVGVQFRIGEAILEGVELAEPCDGLAKQTGYGKKLLTALLHRGGLRAAIVQAGIIKAGDRVKPLL